MTKMIVCAVYGLSCSLAGVYALGKQVTKAKVECARLFFLPAS